MAAAPRKRSTKTRWADGASDQDAFKRAKAQHQGLADPESELIARRRPVAGPLINKNSSCAARQGFNRKAKKERNRYGIMAQDLRYAVRMLPKAKASLRWAVLSLALGNRS